MEIDCKERFGLITVTSRDSEGEPDPNRIILCEAFFTAPDLPDLCNETAETRYLLLLQVLLHIPHVTGSYIDNVVFGRVHAHNLHQLKTFNDIPPKLIELSPGPARLNSSYSFFSQWA